MMSDSQRSHHARHMMSADRYRHWCGDPQLDTLRDALGCGGADAPLAGPKWKFALVLKLFKKDSFHARDETNEHPRESTKVQKYQNGGEKRERKDKPSNKGTNTKSHTKTQKCTSEARRRPKAPKQRSNAMRQARDKQHSSSGAATAQQQRPEGLPKLVHHINPLILRPRRT